MTRNAKFPLEHIEQYGTAELAAPALEKRRRMRRITSSRMPANQVF